MYVIVSTLDENIWLCYDGLSNEYFYKPAFDYRAIMCKTLEQMNLNDIPSKFSIKPMKLKLVEV